MNRESEIDPAALDAEWDELADTGHTDNADLTALHRSDRTPGPAPGYTERLRRNVLAEALTMTESTTAAISESSRIRQESPVEVAALPRLPQPRPLVKWTSLLAAGLLLFAIVAGLNRYVPNLAHDPERELPAPFAQSSPKPSLAFANVTMDGADVQNSNRQPGPVPVDMPTSLKSNQSISGNSMVLVEDQILVAGYGGVAAYDASTLGLLWRTPDSDIGYWGPILVANGTALVGFTLDPETGGDDPENNQLVSLDVSNGSELWRTAGAGASGSRPVVVGSTIYSVSGTLNSANFGAYDLDTGERLWQAPLSGIRYCCSGITVAVIDKVAVVQSGFRVMGLSLTDGREYWSVASRDNELFGEPLIVGPTLAINSRAMGYPVSLGHPSPSPSNFGTTLLLDLQTGTQIGEVPNQMVNLAGIDDGDLSSIVAAGIDVDSGQTLLWRYGALNGDQSWSTDLNSKAGSERNYTAISVDPVKVGDRVIVISSVADDGSGSIGQSVLTQADIETGSIDWQVQFDGGISADPIVSGGHIFVLTNDLGLLDFSYNGGSSASPAASPEVADFRTPVVCSASPIPNPLLSDLPATPTIPQVAAHKAPFDESQVPVGTEQVDSETATALSDLFTDYRNCSAEDPYNGVFGFFSTDFYVRLLADGPEYVEGSVDQPWAIWMAPMVDRLVLDAASLQILPDGRTGGFAIGRSMPIYIWFVQEDGVWKIDEYHRIVPIRPTNTPVPPLPPLATPSP